MANVAAVTASVVVALGLAVVGSVPAAADVAALSPPSREVDPGGSVSTTVTVRASGLTCLSARPSDASLQPSFGEPRCDDEPEWRTTMFVQVPDEPGSYSVRVTDDQSGDAGGRTFTLIVREPAPPPPPPTTTAPTTTTARPTTTTAPRTTTTATTAPPDTAPTTVAETTTTTAPLEGDPFTPLAALVERPIPAEGVFLPLLGDGYRNCLPLTGACRDAGSALALVPARTSEVTWAPVAEGTDLAPRTDLRSTAPLSLIGVGPAEPRSYNYALPVLDLTTAGGRLRTLERGMDERGVLGIVSTDQPLVRPAIEGPAVAVGDADSTSTSSSTSTSASSSTSTSAMPFGRPSVRAASSFTEAAPAIPMWAAAEPQVVFAIRPDNAWGLNLDLIPLFGASVPFLVRAVDGPPGLFIARPASLRVPPRDSPDETAASDDENDGDGGDRGGLSAVALLGGAVGIGAVATAATAMVRRRRRA